jgi:hypothetical protein
MNVQMGYALAHTVIHCHERSLRAQSVLERTPDELRNAENRSQQVLWQVRQEFMMLLRTDQAVSRK